MMTENVHFLVNCPFKSVSCYAKVKDMLLGRNCEWISNIVVDNGAVLTHEVKSFDSLLYWT